MTPETAAKFFKARKAKLTYGEKDVEYYFEDAKNNYIIEDLPENRRNVWIDNRTERKSRWTVVYPCAMSDVEVYVICPHCNTFRSHPIVGGKYAGFYTCFCDQSGGVTYYIENLKAK